MTPDSLRALARYQTVFEAHGFRFATERNEPGSMPYNELSVEAEAFIRDAYAHDWVIADFDWSEWAQTREAARLQNTPEALSDASEEDLRRLLTVAIRSERFCDGALAAAFDSGLLQRIVRRASALVAEG